MELTPDTHILFEISGIPFNATIVNSWVVMVVITAIARLVTWNLRPDVAASRWRTALEVIVKGIESQISEITGKPSGSLIYFVGTLFLFIAVSNLLVVVPGFYPPTSSLSTTAALAACVFFAVPGFGIARHGIGRYLHRYIEPSIVMLPFNIIGEFSRALALAIRLYGNVMSGAVIAAILLGVAPFFFPVVMDMLALLTGLIQAYIFAVLATVYIAAATNAATEPTLEKGD